jgi:L-rhamnose isomerase/sugar isomerase
MRAIYTRCPAGWRVFWSTSCYEPAFYSTVIDDWGTATTARSELREKAQCSCDLGHHAPNVNIEMIVARPDPVRQARRFHFNDQQVRRRRPGRRLDQPFQLFLVFNELVDAELARVPGFTRGIHARSVAQRHQPIESLVLSVVEVLRAYVHAHSWTRGACVGAGSVRRHRERCRC